MPTLTVDEKRSRLKQWVARKNAAVERRRYDWQELWIELEPYFIECEGDDKFKLELMFLATNYR